MLLQEHTKLLLENSLASGPHGLLLSGPAGAGKGHAARYYAFRRLGLGSMEELARHPYLQMIAPENGSIGIEQIRELQRFLQLKTPGTEGIRRIAILEDAHLMTNEAQNALLKALEEPPADTVLILTAPSTIQLKDTVYSRVQRLAVLPVSKQQALAYFTPDFDTAAIEKAYAISNGFAGLLYALLHAKDHALVQQIERAKELLRATTFDRLTQVDELSKQRDTLPLLFHALKLICSTALHQAATKGNQKQVKHWHKVLDAIYQAEAALPHNPNSKLLLTDLFLHL